MDSSYPSYLYLEPTLNVDLLPKLNQWINTTPQSMGNWTSKEAIAKELETVQVESFPVTKGALPLTELNEALLNNEELTVIGFDVLQVPRYKLSFVRQ